MLFDRLSFGEVQPIINELVELGGLSQGYLRTDGSTLERKFRDIRASTLMFHNDKLRSINGRLTMTERMDV